MKNFCDESIIENVYGNPDYNRFLFFNIDKDYNWLKNIENTYYEDIVGDIKIYFNNLGDEFIYIMQRIYSYYEVGDIVNVKDIPWENIL